MSLEEKSPNLKQGFNIYLDVWEYQPVQGCVTSRIRCNHSVSFTHSHQRRQRDLTLSTGAWHWYGGRCPRWCPCKQTLQTMGNNRTSDTECHVRQLAKIALRTVGNRWYPHYQKNRTTGLICWRHEAVAVALLLLHCQQLSIRDTEGLLSVLEEKNPSPHHLFSIFPTSDSYFCFGNALFRPSVFLSLFSGRLSLWEGILVKKRSPLSFPRVCRVCVVTSFRPSWWNPEVPWSVNSQSQSVTWPAFPHRSHCGVCVCPMPCEGGKHFTNMAFQRKPDRKRVGLREEASGQRLQAVARGGVQLNDQWFWVECSPWEGIGMAQVYFFSWIT